MLETHGPYSSHPDTQMFGSPEPPHWPRTAARIVGTIGLALVAPFALLMLTGTVLNLVEDGASTNPSAADYLLMSLITVTSATLALGLLVAWWHEGLGALLIFAGSGSLALATFGLSLPFTFPAPFVGGLYLLSWALHRTGDSGSGNVDRLSRWIRRSYYGQRTETF